MPVHGVLPVWKSVPQNHNTFHIQISRFLSWHWIRQNLILLSCYGSGYGSLLHRQQTLPECPMLLQSLLLHFLLLFLQIHSFPLLLRWTCLSSEAGSDWPEVPALSLWQSLLWFFASGGTGGTDLLQLRESVPPESIFSVLPSVFPVLRCLRVPVFSYLPDFSDTAVSHAGYAVSHRSGNRLLLFYIVK